MGIVVLLAAVTGVSPRLVETDSAGVCGLDVQPDQASGRGARGALDAAEQRAAHAAATCLRGYFNGLNVSRDAAPFFGTLDDGEAPQPPILFGNPGRRIRAVDKQAHIAPAKARGW